MKWRYAAYGFLALAAAFTCVAGYLFYSQSTHEAGAVGPGTAKVSPRSVKAGRIVIAYAGDLMGNLDPCG